MAVLAVDVKAVGVAVAGGGCLDPDTPGSALTLKVQWMDFTNSCFNKRI